MVPVSMRAWASTGEVEDRMMNNARKTILTTIALILSLALPMTALAAIKTKTIAYKDGDQALQGLLACQKV